MKQFKTDEEQFRKFIIRAERLMNEVNDSSQYIYNLKMSMLNTIENYKKELGMLKHPDAVKSTRYVEVELPLKHH